MPIFYLHQWCGEDFIEDSEGFTFASLEDARIEAIKGARSLLGEEARCGRFDLDQRFELHDAAGVHRLTVRFEDTIEIVWPAYAVRRGLSEASG